MRYTTGFKGFLGDKVEEIEGNPFLHPILETEHGMHRIERRMRRRLHTAREERPVGGGRRVRQVGPARERERRRSGPRGEERASWAGGLREDERGRSGLDLA